jgi:hypothetical protein
VVLLEVWLFEILSRSAESVLVGLLDEWFSAIPAQYGLKIQAE